MSSTALLRFVTSRLLLVVLMLSMTVRTARGQAAGECVSLGTPRLQADRAMEAIASVPGHPGLAVSVARDGTLLLWDLSTGASRFLPAPAGVTSLSFGGAPDRCVISTRNHGIVLLDLLHGEQLGGLQAHASDWRFHSAVASTDTNRVVAVTVDSAVTCWGLHGNREWRFVFGYSNPVVKAFFVGRDTDEIVVVHALDGVYRVRAGSLAPPELVYSLPISGACGDSGSTRVVLSEGSVLTTLDVARSVIVSRVDVGRRVQAHSVSPDGQLVACSAKGTIVVANSHSGEVSRLPYDNAGGIQSLEFDCTGRILIACGAEGEVALFDLANRRRVWTRIQRGEWTLAACGARECAAMGGPGDGLVLLGRNGRRMRLLSARQRESLIAVGFDRAGIALAFSNGRVWSYSVEKGPVLLPEIAGLGPLAMARFSRSLDSMIVLGTRGDLAIRYLAAEQERQVSLGRWTNAQCVAVSGNGEVAACGFPGAVTVWQVAPDRSPSCTLESGSTPLDLGISPSGDVVAWVDDRDRVTVWRPFATRNDRLVVPLPRASAVAVTDDVIGVGCATGRILSFRSDTGEVVSDSRMSAPVRRVCGLDDGRFAALSEDGMVRIWGDRR